MKFALWKFYLILAVFSLCLHASTITSASSGNWSLASTWVGGAVPTPNDDVIIANGHTVYLDSTFSFYCKNLTVGKGSSGKLSYQANSTAATTLTISGDFILAAGAQFILGSMGSYKPTVYLSGNLSVGNTATFNPISGSTKGVILVFNNPNSGVDQTITATGTPTTFVMGFMQINRPLPTDKVVCNCNLGMKGGGDGFMLTCGTFEQTAGRFTLPSLLNANATCSLGYPNGRVRVTGSGSMLFTSAITGANSTNGMACQMYINTTDTVFVGASTSTGIQGGTKFVNDGILTLDAGTLNINGRLLTEAGGSTIINGGTVNLDPQMAIALTGSSSTLEVLMNGSFTMSGGTINIIDPLSTTGSGADIKMSTSATYNVTGGTINLGDGISTSTGVDGFQINAHNFPFWNLNIRADGSIPGRALTLTDGTAPRNLVVKNNLNINSGTVYANVATGSNITLGGTMTNNGTLNLGTSSAMIFNGSAAQNTGAAFPAVVPNLTINNASGVTLSKALTVNGVLNLTNGILTLGENNLILGDTASISGSGSTANMIDVTDTGELRKQFAAAGSFVFPIGNAGLTPAYTPVDVVLNSGILNSAYVGVHVSNAKHANNTSTTDYLNRYWTLTSNGITEPDYSAIFIYDAADVVGNESNIASALYDGSSWTSLGSVNSLAHSISVNGISAFGIFSGITGSGSGGSGTVNVTVIPQGFYNSGGYLNTRDTIEVLLANVASPYEVVDSTYVIVDSLTFTAPAEFSTAATGSYYLVVKHRNSVELWSAAGINYVKGESVSYDFTSAASQAYGNNEIEVASGVYAMLSGDCNQDGYVDPLDLSMVDQDSFNYIAGSAVQTDVNGDQFVDPLDLSVVDQNSFNYVGIQKPSALKMISAKERAASLPYYRKWIGTKKSGL
jgi:hypothetical protein